ncbi:uncharacterized protein LOC121915017 [Sceloporus undulatus]|uniref:uncharacterized protein LOC121915017 n=1 Tax=Sceloporus undulatus TaxID=8520 RepID=UPI001C4D0BCB|nr:uncharacterized protein LOC121915017 [Sceloporus undulatus]
MMGSLVPFHLFLGWALLLGQPVLGQDFEDPQVALEEEEEDWEEHESPLEEDSVEEEPLPESWEDLAPSGEDSEELERQAERRLRGLKEHGEAYPEMGFYKTLALRHYNNRHPGPLYRHLEDTEVQIQKALGTLLTFTVYLVNTNCTTEDRRLDSALRAHLRDMGELVEEYGMAHCGLPPESEQQKLKCIFTLFLNGRGSHPAVIDHYCQPIDVFDEPLAEE